MPYGEPDATDPMTLHGVIVETKDGGAMREMAECFVEEYIRIGFEPERILRMFSTHGYAGPNLAYQTLGDDAIRAIIHEQMALRKHQRVEPFVKKANGDIRLTVLG